VSRASEKGDGDIVEVGLHHAPKPANAACSEQISDSLEEGGRPERRHTLATREPVGRDAALRFVR
jgi:hypothetical protein